MVSLKTILALGIAVLSLSSTHAMAKAAGKEAKETNEDSVSLKEENPDPADFGANSKGGVDPNTLVQTMKQTNFINKLKEFDQGIHDLVKNTFKAMNKGNAN
jgi:hypothetical protein